MVYCLNGETVPDIRVVGGKARALIEMSKAGFQVPDGFVLPVGFFRAWLEIIKSSKEWERFMDEHTRENCDFLKTLAEDFSFDDSQRFEIEESMKMFENDGLFAVRSSSPEEDTAIASFAGEYETTLGVNMETLEHAVLESFISMFDIRVVEYKIQNNIPVDDPQIAVIVQQQIDSETSGVAFSQNPQNGRRDEVMINANYGLGETVVSGHVTPDLYLVRDSELIEVKVADKHVSIVLEEGGGTKAVENERHDLKCLSDEEILQVESLVRKVEKYYKKPMDIEWAFEHGKLYLLQARPITTVMIYFNWDVESLGRGTMYAHAGIAESMPSPLCPLYADFAAIHVPSTLVKLMERLLGEGKAEMMRDTRFITVNGYGYYGMKANLRMLWPFVRRAGLLKKLLSDHPYWVEEEELPKIRRRLLELEKRDLETVDGNELVEMAHELNEMICRYYTYCQIYLAQAYKSEGIFNQFYNRKIKPKTGLSSHVFMVGEDSLPIMADKDLFLLSKWVNEDEVLRRILIQTKHIEEVFSYGGTETKEFVKRFKDHMDRYGHMIYDLDFSKATPAENPQPVFEALKLYIEDESLDPFKRQEESLFNRMDAEEEVRKAVSESTFKRFKKKLDIARSLAPYRENGLANLGICQPFLRKVLLEIGRRLESLKVIDKKDDVFWLGLEDINAFIDGKDIGNKSEEVEERKEMNRAQARVNPPLILPEHAKMMGFSVDAWLPKEIDDDPDATEFEGIGVGGGCVTGKARVINSPDEFDSMEKGEILVTAMTTPAWTPLFALAKGIVTDFGGPLSHSSIVAREYNIPAVLGTGGVSKRIKSGQTILVDGDKGIVKIKDKGGLMKM